MAPVDASSVNPAGAEYVPPVVPEKLTVCGVVRDLQ
jgi:hypothetical protein